MRFLHRGSLISWIVLAGCSEDSSGTHRALVDAGFVNEVSTPIEDARPADTSAAETSSSESGTDTAVAPDVDVDSDVDPPG